MEKEQSHLQQMEEAWGIVCELHLLQDEFVRHRTPSVLCIEQLGKAKETPEMQRVCDEHERVSDDDDAAQKPANTNQHGPQPEHALRVRSEGGIGDALRDFAKQDADIEEADGTADLCSGEACDAKDEKAHAGYNKLVDDALEDLEEKGRTEAHQSENPRPSRDNHHSDLSVGVCRHWVLLLLAQHAHQRHALCELFVPLTCKVHREERACSKCNRYQREEAKRARSHASEIERREPEACGNADGDNAYVSKHETHEAADNQLAA